MLRELPGRRSGQRRVEDYIDTSALSDLHRKAFLTR